MYKNVISKSWVKVKKNQTVRFSYLVIILVENLETKLKFNVKGKIQLQDNLNYIRIT